MKKFFTRMLGVCSLLIAFSFTTTEASAQCAVVPPACVDVNSAEYADVVAADPFCCNTAWDSICQNAYNALNGSCLCSVTPPACVLVPSTAYDQVVANDTFCCNTDWDSVCQDAYDALSNSCTGACIAPPACVDTNSADYTTVVTNDPFCCNTAWDSICQNAYNNLNGSCLCTATPPTCVNILSNAYLEVIGTDAFCCEVEWDSVCQAAYDALLPGNPCTLDCPDLFANIGDPCFTGGPFPGVVDASCTCVSTGVCAEAPACVDTNSSAYDTVINSDTFCCQTAWDSICQSAYDFLSGTCDGTDPCVAVPPTCVNLFGAAYAQVIASDAFCCEVEWDSVCQDAYDLLSNTCTGACIIPPACVDTTSPAYTTVVTSDPFCCNTAWDTLCQNAYNALNGSCLCSVTPPACVIVPGFAYDQVVANDPFCCNTGWDDFCQDAYDALSNSCTGACITPPAEVDTNNPCYATVIAADPFCCNTSWDGICQNAYNACTGTGPTCFVVPPACVNVDGSAYATVIASDPFCCNTAWDAFCQSAYDALDGSCGTPVCAATPDCVDTASAAYATVIASDPFCCNNTWDGVCQAAYDAISSTCVVTCNVDGGTVATNDQRTGLCKGDGQADLIQFTVSGNVGVGFFGIVRQSDLEVVASNATGLFNIENLPAGNYFAGHVSVENLSQLAGITNVNQLSGCFDLSNQLAVTSIQLAGGTVTTGGVTTVCGGNVTATVSGNQGPQSRFVLLNQTATIVIAQNQTGVFNFTPLANGIYRIVHISFSNVNLGTITPPVLPKCVASSNLVTVTKVSCPSAMLESSPNPTSGTSYVTFSVPTEEYTTLEVYDMSGRKVTELFRQVTEADAQYRLEFDGLGLPNGVYIYRLTTGTDVIIEKFMIAK